MMTSTIRHIMHAQIHTHISHIYIYIHIDIESIRYKCNSLSIHTYHLFIYTHIHRCITGPNFVCAPISLRICFFMFGLYFFGVYPMFGPTDVSYCRFFIPWSIYTYTYIDMYIHPYWNSCDWFYSPQFFMDLSNTLRNFSLSPRTPGEKRHRNDVLWCFPSQHWEGMRMRPCPGMKSFCRSQVASPWPWAMGWKWHALLLAQTNPRK